MTIFICAATSMELSPLQEKLRSTNHTILFGTHGVGILEAGYAIAEFCDSKPDLIIQCGIAGSYDSNLKLGDVCFVAEEQLGDCGAEDHENIIHYSEFSFINNSQFPFENGKLRNPYQPKLIIPSVSAITVNLCAGNEKTIAYRKNKFKASLETMEGAALHYTCLKKSIPFIQIRGISNYIEPRNLANWKTELAIENYSSFIQEFINQLK